VHSLPDDFDDARARSGVFYTRETRFGRTSNNEFSEKFGFLACRDFNVFGNSDCRFNQCGARFGDGILTYYYGRAATESTWHDVSGWLGLPGRARFADCGEFRAAKGV
jgi:hypothetical protein